MNGEVKHEKNENITSNNEEIEELYKKAKYRKLFSEKIRHGFYVNRCCSLCDFGHVLSSNLRIYGKSMKELKAIRISC